MNNRNNKCSKIYSNFYCHGTHGIDAFAHSWEREVLWIGPPIKDVAKTVKRLKQLKVVGVLFVPE